MLDFIKEYGFFLKKFDETVADFFENSCENIPSNLLDAMKYAVLNGGKRVRPILCFATAKMLGIDLEEVKNYALAIEFIHSYSLVHDDLPAMDNDDYRRGKLSTHKKFGEDIGILTGDALLNTAFEICFNKKRFDNADLECCKLIGEYAGAKGMIAGQVFDMELTGKEGSEDKLLNMIIGKTSRLIALPILISSLKANKNHYDTLLEFGIDLGILFQITDDILDVESDLSVLGKTPHKDEEENKVTAIKVFGENGAKEKAKFYYEKCKSLISSIPNSDFLSAFTDNLYLRKR